MQLMTTSEIYAVGVPIILMMIGLEVIFSVYKKRDLYSLGDTGGTLGLLAGNIFVSLSTQGLMLGLYFYLYQFRLITINDLFPPWLIILATFLMVDLVFYWYHRASHRV